jgi:hypothetical protein
MATFHPSVGQLTANQFQPATLAFVTPVTHRLGVECRDLAAAPCLDFAVSYAREHLRDGVPGSATVRVVQNGLDITLEVDGVEQEFHVATVADLVAKIRKLESGGKTVTRKSVEARHLEYDWSGMDIVYTGSQVQQRVPRTVLRWSPPPGSLRQMFEALHILVDEIYAAGMSIEPASYELVAASLLPSLRQSLGDSAPVSDDVSALGVWLIDFTRLSDIGEHHVPTLELAVGCKLDS